MALRRSILAWSFLASRPLFGLRSELDEELGEAGEGAERAGHLDVLDPPGRPIIVPIEKFALYWDQHWDHLRVTCDMPWRSLRGSIAGWEPWTVTTAPPPCSAEESLVPILCLELGWQLEPEASWQLEKWQGLPFDPAVALVENNVLSGLYVWREFHDVSVWPQPIHDERQHSAMVKLAIATANKFSILTSYALEPERSPYRDDATGPALLSSIIERMSDPVTIVFAYHYNSLKQVGFGKTSVAIEKGVESGWQEHVVLPLLRNCAKCAQAVEQLQNDTSSVQAKVYFVELGPHGPFGSWHTKFVINDRGMFSTTGWSLANYARPNWVDAGFITIDKSLAKQEANFFSKTMLHRTNQDVNVIRRLAIQGAGSNPKEAFTFVELEAGEMEELQATLETWDNEPTGSFTKEELAKAGFTEQESQVPFVTSKNAVSLRNKGHDGGDVDYRPRNLPIDGAYRGAFDVMKPINLAMWLLFQMAENGDTIWVRCKSSIFYMATGDNFFNTEPPIQWQWAKYALERGVNVKYLATLARNEKKSSCGPDAETQTKQRKFMGESYLPAITENMLSRSGTSLTREDFAVGKEMHKYLKELAKIQVQVRAMKINGTSGKQVECDHGKVYALEKKKVDGADKRDVWIGIGSWNNDMQSMRGSNENTLFVSDKVDDRNKRSSVFYNFLEAWWEEGEELSLWDEPQD